MRERSHFLLLNIAHLLDHLFMLVFASVAALTLSKEWGMSYGELVPYAMPGFVAFGLFAIPAGWIADRWSREGMMCVFFVGIGLAAIVASMASTPWTMAVGLFAIGLFAAIYHPVGIALVLEKSVNRGMRTAINGVWGNMGVAIAALFTGFMIDTQGWRAAFVWPGLLSIALGLIYWALIYRTRKIAPAVSDADRNSGQKDGAAKVTGFYQALAVILFTTALGGLVFQSTTFALPKVLEERAGEVAGSATMIGWLAFTAFAVGSIGQLIVGYWLDRTSARKVFMLVAAMQVVFFASMVQASGVYAIAIAVGFMLAAFGQIPINDVLVGRIANSGWRSRILAIRYTTTILVMASSVPLIGWIHRHWGFTPLFVVLALAAVMIFCAVCLLPRAARTAAVAAA